jgi:hypothetical protein
MGRTRSRRSLLALLTVLVSGGCTGSDDGSTPTGGADTESTETATQTACGSESADASDDETMTPTDHNSNEKTPVPPAERDELVERLPETSPLTGPLEALVAGSDRAAVAEEYGLEFREKDHSVRVRIELESGGRLPERCRVEVVGQYQDYITAYIHVDDLVPVGIDDGVRKVRRPPESRPDGQTGNNTDL